MSTAPREQRLVLAGLFAWFGVTAAWWLLALWPVPDAPIWLERTRYVCFGVNDRGLPDAGGWIGLTAGPLGMLIILVVGWRSSIVALVRRAPSSYRTAFALSFLIVGVLTIPAGALMRVLQASAPEPTDNFGLPASAYPRLDTPAPHLHLVTQHGDSLALTALRGRPVLVTFAFGHCATVCPAVVRRALGAQALLRNTAAYPAVMVVTVDPWRDTPATLARMAEAWHLPRVGAWALSGDVASVQATLDRWKVPRTRDPHTGDITHAGLIYVVDGGNRIAFAAAAPAATIAALTQRAQAEAQR